MKTNWGGGGELYAVEQAGNLEDGKLFEFDNSGYDYTVTGLDVTTPPITIACSLKTEDPYTESKEIWAETLSISMNKIRIGIETGDSATEMRFFYDSNGTKSYPCGKFNVPFANKQTHTYIITYDNTDKVWKLYVDGVERGSSVGKSSAFLYNGYNYTHAVGENATIDNWRLYSRVLDTSEIKAYTEEFPPTPSFRLAPRIIVK